MAKLFKMFMVLMALGLIVPSSIIAENLMNTSENEDVDFDLKNLEEELRRLLEDQEAPKIEAEIAEKETLVIHPSKESDEAQKLEIEYKEPISNALKQELKAQPMEKEEIIILDEIEGDDFDEEEEIS